MIAGPFLGQSLDAMDALINAIRDMDRGIKIATFRFEDASRGLYNQISSIFTYQKQRVGPQVEMRTFFKGTKEYIYFVKVDPDGIASEPMGQMWHRAAKKQLKPKQAPPRRLRFWTANRCDHNRGRSWDRKAA